MNYLKLMWAGIIVAALTLLIYFNYGLQNQPQSQSKDALDIYIDRLADYECRDCLNNYRRIDSNGYYSYSCLQFQKATFLQAVKRYKLAEGQSADNLDLMIYSCDFQKKLAREMFLNDSNAYLHWKTSIITRGLGLPPTIID